MRPEKKQDTFRVRNVVRNIAGLRRGQKVVVGALAVLIVLTWLAVCFVVAGLLMP